jgi:transcription elongation factor Elf1
VSFVKLAVYLLQINTKMGCGVCKGQNLGELISPPVQKHRHPQEVCQENLDTLVKGEQRVGVIQTKIPQQELDESVESAQRPIDTYGKSLDREVRERSGRHRGPSGRAS